MFNNVTYKQAPKYLHIGDTVTFILKFENPQFENQYLLLTDSIKPGNLLDYDNLIQSSDGIEVEIQFLCINKGYNKISGIVFNTSIEVIEYVNDKEYLGRRVGVFEKFEINYFVKE